MKEICGHTSHTGRSVSRTNAIARANTLSVHVHSLRLRILLNCDGHIESVSVIRQLLTIRSESIPNCRWNERTWLVRQLKCTLSFCDPERNVIVQFLYVIEEEIGFFHTWPQITRFTKRSIGARRFFRFVNIDKTNRRYMEERDQQWQQVVVHCEMIWQSNQKQGFGKTLIAKMSARKIRDTRPRGRGKKSRETKNCNMQSSRYIWKLVDWPTSEYGQHMSFEFY